MGLKINITIDALLPELISRTDLLLLGVDAIGKSKFINKIGSKVLLKAAREKNIRSVVIFESLKLTDIPDDFYLKDDYNYREVWAPREKDNITIINQYFEIVPNKMADMFISDFGIDTPLSLRRRFADCGF
jgi:translation initiation factor 2B subunit (eIF-2B alpha/beta/delta family)